MVNRALFSSVKQTWQSPPQVLNPVRKMGRIGLDPCTTKDNPTGAIDWWWEDGLVKPWDGYGLVYVNPPYGREIGKWTRKVSEEAARRTETEIIMLVPARTDTRWFNRDCFKKADRICFWTGRLRFVGAKDSAPFPSAIVYYGTQRFKFDDVFGDHGYVIAL